MANEQNTSLETTAQSAAQQPVSKPNTPSLYTMYNKQYDYDDFQRRADLGLNDYLNSLKRGVKDLKQFLDAYSNIMAGIRDGSITFLDGRYTDSRGRYSNSLDKDLNKDYYGLMANYIFSKLADGKEYVDPSKKKWESNATGGAWLLNNLFRAETPNIANFIGLDSVNKKTKKRGTTNRVAALVSGIDNLTQAITDGLFVDFDETNKAQYLLDLAEARTRLTSNGLTDDDYYYLNRVFGNDINFRDWFGNEVPTATSTGEATDASTTSATTTTPEATQATSLNTASTTSTTNTASTTTFDEDAFTKWIEEKFPRPTSNQAPEIEIIDLPKSLKKPLYDKLTDAIAGLDRESLKIALLTALVKPSTRLSHLKWFLKIPELQSLSNACFLKPLFLRAQRYGIVRPFKNDSSKFYIAGSDNAVHKGTSLVYDSKSNKVQVYHFGSIPEIRDRFKKQYESSLKKHKQGGVLYAKAGTNIISTKKKAPTYGDISILWTLDSSEKLLNELYNLFTKDGKFNYDDFVKYVLQHADDRVRYGINKFGNEALVTPNDNVLQFNNDYQTRYKILNELLFGATLQDYKGRKGLAYPSFEFSRLSTGGDDPNGNYQNGFLGLQSFIRTLAPTDKNLKDFGNWGKFWSNSEHGGYTGAYYYSPEGTEDQGYWIPTNDTSIDGYRKFGEGLNSGLDAHRTRLPESMLNPESLKPETVQEQIFGAKESHIDPRNNPYIKRDNILLSKTINNILPNVLSAGRLMYALYNNNKIADATRKGLNPVLKNPYDLYSRVEGDFLAKQLAEQQGNNYMSLASKDRTSDAVQGTLSRLEALAKANEKQYEGFLADNKRIKETSDLALQRMEKSRALRNEVANANMASVYQTNKERALLESSRIKSNWKAIDTWLKEILEKKEAEQTEKKAYELKIAQNNLENDYTEITKSASQALQALRYKYATDPELSKKQMNLPYDPEFLYILDWLTRQHKILENKLLLAYGRIMYGLEDASSLDYETFTPYSLPTTSAKKGAKLIHKKFKL